MEIVPSPRWLRQVLKDRGISPPPLNLTQAFVSSLTSGDRQILFDQLKKVALGVERTGYIDTLLAHINSAEPGAPEPDLKQPRVVRNTHSEPPKNKEMPKKAKTDTPWYRGEGFHAYSTGCAMKVELDALSAEEGDRERYTVQIEMANAAQAEPRGYDWHNKIAFQFTRRELPLLAAFLLGYGEATLRFSNHGPDRNKAIEIKSQGQGLYVRLGQAGQWMSMPLTPCDVYEWGVLAMRALQINSAGLDTPALLQLLRRVGGMESARDR